MNKNKINNSNKNKNTDKESEFIAQYIEKQFCAQIKKEKQLENNKVKPPEKKQYFA